MINYNKKLIFKKFFLDNTYFFLICILSLSVIVWVIQAVNFLDFVTEDGHGLVIYFKYTLLNLPKIISRLMPFIFFVAIFHTINKSEDNNELKIFWINGIDKKEFANAFLKYSFIYLVIQIILNSLIVPLSQNKARTYIQSSSIDFFPSLINEKKFIDTVDKLTIYVERKGENNDYENIFLKDSKNKNSLKIIQAEKGLLINNENERSLKLFNGKIVNINNGNINSFDFKTTIFDLSSYLTKSITDFKIQEKSSSKLINCYINFHLLNDISYYHILDCNTDSLNILQQELLKRLIKPFYYISLVLSACFLFLFSKENFNQKYFRSIIFILGTLILVISELTTSLAAKNLLYFKLAIILPFLLIAIQYIFLHKKIYYYQ
ncbi:LptF/LptG family permease [Pelagibacterales bacterium SAG-MED39]|nr:LptF/LptG family permease [Pelagibacterales bacterium SAG-MED39]